jgi:hypothetical protein
MVPDSAVEANAVLAISGICEDKPNSRVKGFIRIKSVDGTERLPNHVILILDLSLSMHKYLGALRDSIEKIVGKLNPHSDKCTILGFAGRPSGFKNFCGFRPVSELASNFSAYIPEELSTLTGTTDFDQGLKFTIRECEALEKEYNDSYPNYGNTSMRWNEHNHIAIFMTDGKSYGTVPWNSADSLANKGITLHTVGLRQKIDKKVRDTLMKMATKGRGGFNFSRTIEQFHEKVQTLLELSLGAVTKPAKLSLNSASGVTINSASILGHPEHNTKEANPVFEFPALRPGERKILLFDVTVSEGIRKNTRVPILSYTMEPDYLNKTENDIFVPVMPNDVHRGLMRRGPNADYRVHILMQRIEQSLSEALEAAAVRDDISEFKNKAMAALSNSEETIERNFALHPKRGILSEKINQLKEQITSAQTILDPKAFFSTIYAIMRTTR